MFEFSAAGSDFTFKPIADKNKFKFDLTVNNDKFLDAVDSWLGKEAKKILKNGLSLKVGDLALQLERDDTGDVILTKKFKIKELEDGSLTGTFRLQKNTSSFDQSVGNDDSSRIWDDDGELNTYTEYLSDDNSFSLPADLEMNFWPSNTRTYVINNSDLTLQLIPLKPSDDKDYDWSDYKLEIPEQVPGGLGEKMEQISMGLGGIGLTLMGMSIADAGGMLYARNKRIRATGEDIGFDWYDNDECAYGMCPWQDFKPEKYHNAVYSIAGSLVGALLDEVIEGLLKPSELSKIPSGDPIVLYPGQRHEFNDSVTRFGRSNNVNDVEFMVIATDKYNSPDTPEDELVLSYLGKWAFDAPTAGDLKAKVALPGISNDLTTYFEKDAWDKHNPEKELVRSLTHPVFPDVDYTTEYFAKQEGKYWTWDLVFDGSI